MDYYPIFINLKNKTVLVIGQYRILEFKVEKLIEAGAKVRYVSKSLSEKLAKYIKSGKMSYSDEEFDVRHLQDVWLVICGSDDPELKDRIFKETEKQNILCNFVDDTPICSFIAPAVIEKGDVTIAISTSGKSPALSKYLKYKISNFLGAEYDSLAEILGKIRPLVIKNIPDQKDRSILFEKMVKHPKVLELVKNNKHIEAEEMVFKIVHEEISRH